MKKVVLFFTFFFLLLLNNNTYSYSEYNFLYSLPVNQNHCFDFQNIDGNFLETPKVVFSSNNENINIFTTSITTTNFCFLITCKDNNDSNCTFGLYDIYYFAAYPFFDNNYINLNISNFSSSLSGGLENGLDSVTGSYYPLLSYQNGNFYLSRDMIVSLIIWPFIIFFIGFILISLIFKFFFLGKKF